MTRSPVLRRAARTGAVVFPITAASSLASPAGAAVPATWNSPEPMSVLQALLLFGGIPVGIIAVVTLLVTAPSLVRGDRQQRGVSSWTEPQWFGGSADALAAGGRRQPELRSGTKAEQPGGASARW